ncbi:MAG: PilZ domain-containing protein [Methylobacter sp.]|nr:PilZ domain-containing protein [Methylococcales bacterium]MDD5114770.1 PilZ domain-containing protein [Methylobacter sp.]
MSEQINQDNRQFHRVIYKADATLSFDNKTWLCEIIDLSLKGCLLKFDFNWKEDQEKTYILSLQLSEHQLIQMQLSAAHVIGNTAGFKCDHIDLDSISELRRLVELNLGDSSLLERDLQALASY